VAELGELSSTQPGHNPRSAALWGPNVVGKVGMRAAGSARLKEPINMAVPVRGGAVDWCPFGAQFRTGK